MWNIARLDGQWLWFDATADRGISPQFGLKHYSNKDKDARNSWDASQLDRLLGKETT